MSAAGPARPVCATCGAPIRRADVARYGWLHLDPPLEGIHVARPADPYFADQVLGDPATGPCPLRPTADLTLDYAGTDGDGRPTWAIRLAGETVGYLSGTVQERRPTPDGPPLQRVRLLARGRRLRDDGDALTTEALDATITLTTEARDTRPTPTYRKDPTDA